MCPVLPSLKVGGAGKHKNLRKVWYQEQFVTDDVGFKVISRNEEAPQSNSKLQQREMLLADSSSMLTRDYNCIRMCQSLEKNYIYAFKMESNRPQITIYFYCSK